MAATTDTVLTLREGCTERQRVLLDRIWKHQRMAGRVLSRRELHNEQGDPEEVQRVLRELGASVVQLHTHAGDEPAGYRLTVLGALLTSEGKDIEVILSRMLSDIRFRQSKDHKFEVWDHAAFASLCEMYPMARVLVPVLVRMQGPFNWGGSPGPENLHLTVPEEISEVLLKGGDARVLLRALVGRGYRPLSSLDPSSLWRSAPPDPVPKLANAVAPETPHVASDRSEAILREAEALLLTKGAPSAVDRMHTGLNAYLRDVIVALDITAPPKADSSKLIDLLRTHAAFAEIEVRPNESRTILRTLAGLTGQLDAMRNNASNAHATKDLLTEAEAMLAINAARTVMNYVDMRVREHTKTRS